MSSIYRRGPVAPGDEDFSREPWRLVFKECKLCLYLNLCRSDMTTGGKNNRQHHLSNIEGVRIHHQVASLVSQLDGLTLNLPEKEPVVIAGMHTYLGRYIRLILPASTSSFNVHKLLAASFE